MKSATQRSGRPGALLLFLVLSLFLLGLASCGKETTTTVPKPGVPETAPPGAPNDGPADPRVDYADLEYASDGTFTLDGKKFNGIAQEFHKDGTTLSKLYEYKDGMFEGTTREYYENGQISASTQWQKGQRHGPNLYWDKEGKETKRQLYEHDVAVETVIPGEEAETPNP